MDRNPFGRKLRYILLATSGIILMCHSFLLVVISFHMQGIYKLTTVENRPNGITFGTLLLLFTLYIFLVTFISFLGYLHINTVILTAYILLSIVTVGVAVIQDFTKKWIFGYYISYGILNFMITIVTTYIICQAET
ncbi:hypothetical protein SNEBB_000775 [Seison nebaliae]|nr:hypothetical protein SNEBB_000775 [Seison nebaliae]